MILYIFLIFLIPLCKKSFYESRERDENNFDSIWKKKNNNNLK